MAPSSLGGAAAVKSKTSAASTLLVLIHGNRRVLIRRPQSFENAVAIARKSLPNFEKTRRLILATDELPFLDGKMTEISEDAWPETIPALSRLTVLEGEDIPNVAEDHESGRVTRPNEALDHQISPAQTLKRSRVTSEDGLIGEGAIDNTRTLKKAKTGAQKPLLTSSSPPADAHSPSNKIAVRVCSWNGQDYEEYRFSVSPTSTVWKLAQAVAPRVGRPACELRLLHDGRTLDPSSSFVDYGVQDDDVVDLIPEQKGGKPVIYLMAPEGQTIDATVSLQLSPPWSLSAVYPIGTSKGYGTAGQEVSWSVFTKPDGTLHDKATDCDVAYLFWEAETNSHRLDSPPASPVLGGSPPFDTPNAFNPLTCRLTPDNSVLLPIAAVPGYSRAKNKRPGVV